MDMEINKIVKVKNLTKLNIGGTNISGLSESFGELKALHLYNSKHVDIDRGTIEA